MSTTHTTPSASGRKDERDGTAYVVFERTFTAPIADVWAAVTESERLSRWIGIWSGDPTSGSISFFMTAEAEDAPAETIWIDECVQPTRLVMRSARPDDHSEVWSWQIDLAESDGVTTLTFAQEVCDSVLAESVGPGWDYYLDRMVAAETGGDLAAIDFTDYSRRSLRTTATSCRSGPGRADATRRPPRCTARGGRRAARQRRGRGNGRRPS